MKIYEYKRSRLRIYHFPLSLKIEVLKISSILQKVKILRLFDLSSTVIFSGVSAAHELKPETVMLYSWENSLEKRELIWACGGKKDVKNDLSQVILNYRFLSGQNNTNSVEAKCQETTKA